MSHQERIQQVTQSLLDAFKSNQVPEALAKIFIHRDLDSPSSAWSFGNRLLVALHGHLDARGFRQWKAVGRSVKKGQKALYILGPRTITLREDDPDRGLAAGDKALVGFVTIPVFGAAQTEGAPLPYEEEEQRFLDSLPLIEVARAWGISTRTFTAQPGSSLGFYRYHPDKDPKASGAERVIALAVENPVVWAHELIHAADHRLQSLTLGRGQKIDNEIVAQLGAAVLLRCLGLEEESDPGFTWKYIQRYANKGGQEALTACRSLIDRTAACVEYLLQAADSLEPAMLDAPRERVVA